MAKTYYFGVGDPVITDGFSNWNVLLATVADTPATQATTITGQTSTELDYAYTPSGEPNLATWADGDWTVEVNITVASGGGLTLNIGTCSYHPE